MADNFSIFITVQAAVARVALAREFDLAAAPGQVAQVFELAQIWAFLDGGVVRTPTVGVAVMVS